MIRQLIRALLTFEQPTLDYCPQHGGWYPPSHWNDH